MSAYIASLLSRGDFGGAKRACEDALRAGKLAETLRLLAVAESRLGDWERAQAAIAGALALAPDDPVSLNYQGVILAGAGRIEDALLSFDRACALKPGFVPALVNRGNALLDLGRSADALRSFDEAASVEPLNPDLVFLRGRALHTLERTEQAAVCFSRVLKLNSRHVGALNAQAEIMRVAGQPDEALRSWDAVLALDPGNALALQNSATLLHSQGWIAPAIERYERLIRLLRARPHAPEALDYALAMTVSCRREICAWDGLAELERELIDRVRNGQAAFKPFLSLMLSDDPSLHALCASRTWRRLFAEAPRIALDIEKRKRAKERIRVGYLSSDFRDHPTGWLIAGLIERHDRTRFDVYGYSTGPDDGSQLTRRLQTGFDRFIDISQLDDDSAARQIAEDETDILIDLNGLTHGSREGILARRPAPVIVHYLGYPGPPVPGSIDYLVADSFVLPAESEVAFGCAIARLPGTYQVNDHAEAAPLPAPARAEAGLPREGFVFCGFSQPVKLSPPVFDVWARIVKRVPGSILWLLGAGERANENLRREAERRDVDPARVVFAPRIGHAEHLARIELADLMLDTWPCGAHTTATDALWAGVPVVTLPGCSFASRVAGSLLTALDVPGLIAEDVQSYEDIAVQLATTPSRLSALRNDIDAKKRTRPLFDTAAFRKNIEVAYAVMWARFQAASAPGSFPV